MNEEINPKPPIVNCHTHIFTSGHVPPWLAKSYLFKPAYVLIHLPAVVAVFRWWYNGPDKIKYGSMYRQMIKWLSNIRTVIAKLGYLLYIPVILISVHVFYILYGWFTAIAGAGESDWVKKIETAEKWLSDHYLLYPVHGWALQILLIIISFFFIPSLKNLVFLIFKKTWKILGLLPGKNTKELIGRYINIGRYAFHDDQSTNFSQLKRQYPEGSGFVILPMDMEFMDAGSVKKNYYAQMDELADLKNKYPDTFFPFVFIDPRRIDDPGKNKYGNIPFLDCAISEGKAALKDCLVKTFIEEYSFSGFKIYPALGYYVFDPRLLPLWKYAADNGIPIMTHCIRGTIFYRGTKEDDWNRHPIFKQPTGKKMIDPVSGKDKGIYEPLVLPERKNVDFSINFTHPMNYLCLLEEEFLRKVVEKYVAQYPDLRTLFGFTDGATPLKYNLDHLKICFGHFGGEDEFKRYFEQDRYGHSNQLAFEPFFGIDFLKTTKNEPSPGKPEQLWKFTDWYSIICSLMLQHPNVYADISYILHNSDDTLPLLRSTLQHPELQKKVLYGTDFFVVRNHKSDKNILADMRRGLSEEEFDLIARYNPELFLKKIKWDYKK